MGSLAANVANGVIAKWSAAFARLDADALCQLYSKHAMFYGSNPTLYRGRDGVKSYFAALPHWDSRQVQFSDVTAEVATPDVVNMAGIANFTVDGAGLAVKNTWVIIREDGDWKIVSHHVSSRDPLIDQVR